MAKYVKIPDGYFMKFVGEYPSKGLGIVFNNAYGPECYDENLSYAIPLRYEDLFILAFWPTKIDKNESYSHIAIF